MYDLSRWNWAYLCSNRSMPLDESYFLVEEAVDMFQEKEKKRNIRRDWYEGTLYNTGDHAMVGGFGGRKFSAVLDSDKGKIKLEFIVMAEMDYTMN